MNNEMTPGLLALLSPEQREAWERCEKATPGPHQARFLYRMIRLLREHGLEYGLMPGDDEGHDWADADLWANAVSDLPAALLELAQAKAEMAESSAAHYRDITVMADALRELKKFAEGLELNLAAVIQRADAAEKALAELATTSSALVSALNTCHVCAGEVCLDTTEPTHCEDCSADCECHEEDECVPIYVLVDKVSAAIRAARKKV